MKPLAFAREHRGRLGRRIGGRPLRFGRVMAAALSAALLGSLVLSGAALATFAWSDGPTFAAFDTQGHELNVALGDTFGSDGSAVYTGSIGSRSHSWVQGPDGVFDNPGATSIYTNFDLSCDPEEPEFFTTNDPGVALCWSMAINPLSGSGPWGEVVPITTTGLDATPLVFDHWETTNADVGHCFTGEVGTPATYFGDYRVPGPGGAPVLGVGFKAWWDASDYVHRAYTANAIYAPLTPDISAPIVSIHAPLDCQVFEQNASATASFTCVDPGASDPNPTCVGDVANGAFINTSTVGAHTFSVTGTDASDNARTMTIHYTVVPDTTPPETAIDGGPANPSTSSSATLSFHGTDGANGVASLECRLDAEAFAACTSPHGYSNLADGSHTLAVRAIDGAGNVDPTPAVYTWTIDTAPPDTTITGHPSDPSTSASAIFAFEGSDAGTGVAGFECSLDLGGFVACNHTDPVFGYHLKDYGGLADGSHTFRVRAIDALGNVDPTPATYTWAIGVTPPDVAVNQAAGQADPTSGGPIHFTATFSEPVGEFGDSPSDVTLSGTAGATTAVVTQIAPFDGTTFDIAVTGMTGEGTVIVSVPAGAAVDSDFTSNTASTSSDNTVSYATDLAPDTTISSHPLNPSSSHTATFGFSGTDDVTPTSSLTYECKLDAGAFGTCSSVRTYTGQVDGLHTFQVRAIDGTGHVDPTPATFSWTIDTVLPSITIGSPAAQTYTLGQSVTASYSCTDTGSGILSCVGSVANGATIDTSTAGTKNFTATAKDNAGNQASATVTYTVAAPPPAMCLSEANHQILFPIAANGSSVFARGVAVIARFRVCDATGKSISTSGLVQRFRLVGIRTGAITATVDQAVASATRATAFVWDPLLKDWVFAIDTKSLAKGKTYLYRITLRDATTIDFAFTVK
jgi:hypothetical protein